MIDIVVGAVVLLILGIAAHGTKKQLKEGGCAGCSGCSQKGACGENKENS